MICEHEIVRLIKSVKATVGYFDSCYDADAREAQEKELLSTKSCDPEYAIYKDLAWWLYRNEHEVGKLVTDA